MSDTASSHDHHHGQFSDKAKYVSRLKRIEGQARGALKMVDEEQYRTDVLTQVGALGCRAVC